MNRQIIYELMDNGQAEVDKLSKVHKSYNKFSKIRDSIVENTVEMTNELRNKLETSIIDTELVTNNIAYLKGIQDGFKIFKSLSTGNFVSDCMKCLGEIDDE